MKIMISQPMRDKTREEIETERAEIVAELEKDGHVVIDTVFAETTPEGSNASLYYLSKAIEAMSKVDGVLFMQGWENARGCRTEYQIAMEYGKFIRIVQ